MSTGNELVTAHEYLFSKLSADAPLMAMVTGIYGGDEVPPTATYPFLQFVVHGAPSQMATTTEDIIWVRTIFQVKVVGADNTDAANDLLALSLMNARIHAVLHRTLGQVSTGACHACYRVAPLAYPYRADGVTYQHVGGLYAVCTSSS
jgi:hypothetical protein